MVDLAQCMLREFALRSAKCLFALCSQHCSAMDDNPTGVIVIISVIAVFLAMSDGQFRIWNDKPECNGRRPRDVIDRLQKKLYRSAALPVHRQLRSLMESDTAKICYPKSSEENRILTKLDSILDSFGKSCLDACVCDGFFGDCIRSGLELCGCIVPERSAKLKELKTSFAKLSVVFGKEVNAAKRSMEGLSEEAQYAAVKRRIDGGLGEEALALYAKR